MNEVADRLFAAFSKRVGVTNIREWEEQNAAFEESVTVRRAELQQQVRGRGRGRGARVCKVRESPSSHTTPAYCCAGG